MIKFAKKILQDVRNNLLLILLISSLVWGIVMGIAMRSSDVVLGWNKRQMTFFRFPGELLMRMLKALVIPLIVSSLISGLAKLNTSSRKIGLYAVCYYTCTTLIAVGVGVVLVISIRPGFKSQVQLDATRTTESANIGDSILDLLRNIFPDNIVEATFRQTKTKQLPSTVRQNSTCSINDTSACNDTTTTNHMSTSAHDDFAMVKEDGVNAIGLVVFSLAMGIAVVKLGEAGRPLYLLCLSLADATMMLVTAVIWYSPIGIAFLIASEIIQMKDPLMELEGLGWYMLTVLTGLLIHALVILPTIYFLFVRKNPFRYLFHVSQAFVTAFGTSSSSATLPVTYLCLEEKLNIDRRVTRFILPVGAIINMDGTALYEAVAAIFIAQSNGLHVSVAELLVVSITSTLASVATASVPQAGLVTMVIVLGSIGLPPEEATKILAIDWLMDRFQAAVNVESDAIGAGIVNHFCSKYLKGDADTGKINEPDKESEQQQHHHPQLQQQQQQQLQQCNEDKQNSSVCAVDLTASL